MCKFEENVKPMTFENCNLFKRSYTTQGLGYTFNNEIENFAIKKNFRSTSFSPNIGRIPSLMKSTNSDHSLTVIIDVNAEEVDRYETSKGKYTIRSIVCEASCHSFTRSLGHSVTQSLGHLVTWSLGHLVTRSLGHLSTCHPET